MVFKVLRYSNRRVVPRRGTVRGTDFGVILVRAGTEAALALVVTVFCAARPHHVCLFANRGANRMKVLVRDGIGL